MKCGIKLPPVTFQYPPPLSLYSIKNISFNVKTHQNLRPPLSSNNPTRRYMFSSWQINNSQNETYLQNILYINLRVDLENTQKNLHKYSSIPFGYSSWDWDSLTNYNKILVFSLFAFFSSVCLLFLLFLFHFFGACCWWLLLLHLIFYLFFFDWEFFNFLKRYSN